MNKKILVVDDEESIVTLLQYNLERSGYEVITASDGEEALKRAETENPDLIVLDVMLPKLDGIEVCKQLRQQKLMFPILMLTAKDEEFDKVLGLELGADDYMTKPFSPREVNARVKAILRRSEMAAPSNDMKNEETEGQIVIGDLKILPDHYEAYFKENQLELTPKEFELLLYLGRHKGRVLTRDLLLSAVWNYDFAGDTRIVDVHISHLRDKIETNTKKPIYIKTIRGLGYKLEEPKMND
ncbi:MULTISPECIES: two-component system response regulator PhoP [Bacillus]|jgi:two-component system alkaline phosphatase synthesis response regulator PhoP|uniref:Alkaline phosphatase synthesis transcriptional regulatory protein PhoP n=3 Tax=Bacillus mojavensis subgroup TaxID=653388 RepID=A0AAP3G0Q7_BACMO|nr:MULTISPECIES: two-component system response regulator PhoP [Bacillus]MBV7318469.1 two-component system response regulator PhoP [Halalkalibacterium halodurans]BDG81041.1 alkaline phosphatase synthesis transcriptional regulatory protein PhoP [Bacillus subtilis]AZV50566.1 DNA-binding response regulator [Bacillus halotolerans]KUP29610.1 two-component system response regulator [Bacillus halotolerans]KUP34624.1 two-component system response regulator [Bacillus halotolerans]